jgi:prepilin peptidase CpaA
MMSMTEPNCFQWGAVLGASLAAAVCDLRSRRIPNKLTLPLVLAGTVVAAWHDGVAGLGSSLGGCALLALPYILLFAFGGGGAGDAKMMGGIGAWLGLRAGGIVLVAVALVGGAIGLVGMMTDRQHPSRLRDWLASLYLFATTWAGGRASWTLLAAGPAEPRPADSRRGTIPYGPAIFIGACIGAWVVHLWKI